MRRQSVLVCVLAACVMVGSVAEAVISDGPGGRIYLMRKYNADTSGYSSNADYRVEIADVSFTTTWTSGTLDIHGTLRDQALNSTGTPSTVYDDSLASKWFSPEVFRSNPAGYADLVMGLAYDPSSTGTPQTWTPSADNAITYTNTMSVLKVTPSAGTQSVTVIGQGRRADDSAVNGGLKTTLWGFYALPDPKGLFTGDTSGQRIITSKNNTDLNSPRYWRNTGINVNAAYNSGSNPDVTNADADYLFGRNYNPSANGTDPVTGYDKEILNDKLFSVSGSGSADNHKVRYVKSTPGSSTLSDETLWFDAASVPESINQGACIAAGMVKDFAGVAHECVFSTAYEGGTGGIWRLIDLNNDGDAMDCVTIGAKQFREYTKIITGTFSDITTGIRDMEFIKTVDNKYFLLTLVFEQSSGSNYSRNIINAYELLDNGDYTGNMKEVFRLTDTYANAYLMYKTFEVDWQQAIPEPATLLLVGTGALGALGWMRRRKMR